MSNDKTFFGVPIEGDPQYSSEQRIAQRPAQELWEALQPVIQHPKFQGLRWEQYTPFFADGDPCVFGIRGGARAVLAGMDEEDDGGDYGDAFVTLPHTYDYGDENVNQLFGLWNRGQYNRETRTYGEGSWKQEPEDHEFIHQLSKVCEMINSGAFNDALLKAFGDHATVTVRRDKIEIDSYEHD
jgi:hypothetical protein